MNFIIPLIPVLVNLAEKIFEGSGKGEMKKSFVVGILESIFDKGLVKILPDVKGLDEKKLFVETCSLWIEEIVKALKQNHVG